VKKQQRARILTIVSQAVSRGSGGAIDVVVIGHPDLGALREELASIGARVAIHASAAEIPASLQPVAVIDARSAPVDVRITDLLVSLIRLAPSGIYLATAPFDAAVCVGSRHLTLFDAIQAIAELVAGGPEAARGVAVLWRSDGRVTELTVSPMDVRTFFQQAVAAVEAHNDLVLVRRSEAATALVDPIDVTDLPPGPAFERGRLGRAIGAEALAELAIGRFDRRIVAEIDILKRRLARRDRDLAELRAALERSLAAGSYPRTLLGLGFLKRAVAAARSAAGSSDFRKRMRRFERSIRKLWKDPLAALGKSAETR
jgi:hypothetical protein